MNIDGKPHPHSFYRDSDEIRVVEAVTRENQGVTIRSKIEKTPKEPVLLVTVRGLGYRFDA